MNAAAPGTSIAIKEPHKLNAQRRTLMVNTQLFQSLKGALLPDATARKAWWLSRLAPGLYAMSMKRRVGGEFSGLL